MSASVSDSATASLPEIRSSLSSSVAAGAAGVTTAIAGLRLNRLVLRVLARDAGGDLDTAAVEVFLELLLVLAAEAEAVRAHRGVLVADLLLIQALYPSLSFRHISHWLALSSNTYSLTIVMHFSTGQTASHTPQPQHASMLAS